ncbi:hypothetical protein [Telluribacter sp. SYSU D00476]|uniref:hypothetical protein n=1 Tax=Telluribacter sp. SYSU D00476 TaxID=2811430 RepID=UPI001FF4626C|nr:hypothetical protein [Telluribacter sp. SYSU D00476]
MKYLRSLSPYYILIIFSVSIIIIPLLLYFSQFPNNLLSRLAFSDDPERWAHFSDFLNVWVSIANLVLLGMLTFLIHRYEVKKEEERDEDEKRKNRPILVFTFNRHSGLWSIKNAGVQVALNIVVDFKNPDGNNWVNAHKIYSLIPGEAKELDHVHRANTLCAIYEDIFENNIVSIGKNHETKVYTNQQDLLVLKDKLKHLFNYRDEDRGWMDI